MFINTSGKNVSAKAQNIQNEVASFLTPTLIGAAVAFFKTDATLAQDALIGLGTYAGAKLAGSVFGYTVGKPVTKRVRNDIKEISESASMFGQSATKENSIAGQHAQSIPLRKKAENLVAQSCLIVTLAFASYIGGGIAGYKLTKNMILDKKDPSTKDKTVSSFSENSVSLKGSSVFFELPQPV